MRIPFTGFQPEMVNETSARWHRPSVGFSVADAAHIAMHGHGRKAVRARRLNRLSAGVNRLLKAKNYIGARTQLMKLIKLTPGKKKLKCMFAWSYLEQGDIDQGIEVFQMLVRAFPAYKWASLGLFHSLWDKGLRDGAFEEMKRFTLAGGDCQDYRDIVREIYSKAPSSLGG
jgi:hypothetical protein